MITEITLTEFWNSEIGTALRSRINAFDNGLRHTLSGCDTEAALRKLQIQAKAIEMLEITIASLHEKLE